MFWLPFALLAPALWAITNLIDERLVQKDHENPFELMTITGLFLGLPFFALLVFGNISWPGWEVVGIGFITGVTSIAVYIPYFYALRISDAASDMLMWNLTPVIVAIFSFIVFHDILAYQEYIAVGLIVVSSLIAAYIPGKHHFSGALWWMIMASCISSIEILSQEYLFERTTFANGMALISLTIFLIAFVVLLTMRSVRRNVCTRFKGSVGKLMTVNEFLDISAQMSRGFALSIGPVVLVRGVESAQPLFVILFGLLFLRKKPMIPLLQLISASVLAIIGLGLL